MTLWAYLYQVPCEDTRTSIGTVQTLGLGFVRYGVPGLMTIAGIVALFIGGAAAGFGVVIIGFAGMVLLLNVLFRVSILSNKERAEEERARDTYERTGRWPGE